MATYSLIDETPLGEQLDNWCLTTLKPSLRLPVPCTSLLTLVTSSRGLSKTRTPTATQTFLL